ncbi:MAG: histidine kinase [Chloroflexota bacterium]|nr:MAG: histidine kinase [Chloroflexota bacterium]
MANSETIKELESRLSDLQRRWPAHSVPPSMLAELERLEDELEEARREGK